MRSPTRSRLAGRYRLHSLIARGGMADVHRATDVRLEREVAVKILRDHGEAARFDGEIATLAALDHPHLVRLLDAGTDASHGRFLVLELREEPTLAARLATGPLSLDQTARVASDVAEALAYVHARGIVHRDVKPANVFVDDDFHAVLADFGVAKVGGATLTATGTTIGTAAYLAPEQVEGRVPTSAVDVYALGLVMIECLTGTRAFGGTPGEAAVARLVREPRIPDDLPAGWQALLTAMTARDPSSRPAAAAVLARLDTPHTPESTSRTAPLAVPPARRRRMRRTAVAGAAAAVAAGTVTGVLLLGRGGGSPAPPARTGSAVVTTTTGPAPAPSTAQTVVTSAAPRSQPGKNTTKGHDRGGHAGHRDTERGGAQQDGQAG
jgi:serine/threonine protein kinase